MVLHLTIMSLDESEIHSECFLVPSNNAREMLVDERGGQMVAHLVNGCCT